MKNDVSLLLLIVFSPLLFFVVECVAFIDTFDGLDTLPEGLRHIAVTARGDAETDVRMAARIDGCLWLSGGFLLGIGGGCLLGSVGIVGARFYEPSPPPTRLVGKSPEYIDFYVARYKSKRNTAALGSACLGCTAGVATVGCLVTPWATVLGIVAGRMADERGW